MYAQDQPAYMVGTRPDGKVRLCHDLTDAIQLFADLSKRATDGDFEQVDLYVVAQLDLFKVEG